MYNELEDELEPNFPILLPIWWLITWRSYALILCAGLAAVLLFAFLDLVLGVQPSLLVAFLLGLPVGLVFAFWVLNMALRKRYKGFRIAVVSTDPSTEFD